MDVRLERICPCRMWYVKGLSGSKVRMLLLSSILNNKMRFDMLDTLCKKPSSDSLYKLQYVSLRELRRSCLDGFYRPVLKHGPRSLTRMRVCECTKLIRIMKVSSRCEGLYKIYWPATSTGHELLWEVWVRAYLLGPERWWTILE
jgi:hypothetical protein